jgi:regulator of protease activity HflC (stomatin/prohibitin superfamily)
MITLIVLIGVGVFLLFGSVVIVSQQEVKIIERLGKFRKLAMPGLNFKVPLIDAVVGGVDLRLKQLDVEFETKTSDNVLVSGTVSVQYSILAGKVYEAFYRLNNAENQIESFVFDVVLAEVPKLTLDEVFSKKDEIAVAIKTQLSVTMDDFGYEIFKALVTDIVPDEKVAAAMNEINASQRLRAAAAEKAEGEKILIVKAAEAEAESKALQGKGIANQRKAIAEGLKEAVQNIQDGTGIATDEVMKILMAVQYFDTLKEIGGNGNNNIILLPHSPSGVQDIATQIRDQIIAANQVK